MSSHLTAVQFTVRIDGAWRWTGTGSPDHCDPAAVARDHLRRKTASVLRRHSVLHLAAAQDAANVALGSWSCAVSQLEVVGTVQLATTAHDCSVAEEHARRQQTAVLDHEEELQRLAHLQHLLADPDLRRVWWIARFPNRFEDLTALADALEGLPSPHMAGEGDVRSDIRRFTEQLVTDLHTPQQREFFLTALIQTLSALGHDELAHDATDFRRPPETGSTSA